MRICSPQHLEQEIKFLIQVFVENGHEAKKLQEIATSYTNGETEQQEVNDENSKPVVCVPWIPKFGPRIRAMMRKRGIKTVFSSGRNLRDILCNHKSPLPKNSDPGVYKIKCGCGIIYVGETKKKIITRAKEHEMCVFKGQKKMSATAEHASVCNQNFQWNEVETISIQPNWRRRKIREALEIRRHQRSGTKVINRDQGTLLKTDVWNPLLTKMIDQGITDVNNP